MTRKPTPETGWWYDREQLPLLHEWLATWVPASDWTSEVLTAYLEKGYLEANEWQRLKQGAGGWERFRALVRRVPEQLEGLPQPAVVWLGALTFVAESVTDPSSLRLTKGLDQLFTLGLVRSLVQALLPTQGSSDAEAPLRRVLSEVLAFQRVQEAGFASLAPGQVRRLATILSEAESLAMAVVPPARRARHKQLQAVLKQTLMGPAPTAARLNAALQKLPA